MSEKSGLKLLYKFPDDFIVEKMQREEDGRLHISGAFAGEVFARRVAEAKVEPQTAVNREAPATHPQEDRAALRAAMRKYVDSQGPSFLELCQKDPSIESTLPPSRLHAQSSGQSLAQGLQPAQKETQAHAAAPQAGGSCRQEQLEAAQHLVQVLQYVLGRS